MLGLAWISRTGWLCRANTKKSRTIPRIIVEYLILQRNMQVRGAARERLLAKHHCRAIKASYLYNFINIIIMKGKQLQLTIICVLLSSLFAEPSSHQVCSQRQWLETVEEEQLRSDIIRRESGIIAEDRLIFKVINFVMGNSWVLIDIVWDKCIFLMRLNVGYTIALVLLFACFFGYPTVRKYFKASFPFDEASKQTVRKAMAVLLCVVCFLAVAQALRGMDEAEKLKKSLNEVYCKVVQQPKGLIRGASDTGYDAFMQYQKQTENSLLPNDLLLRSSCTKLLMAQYYINITSAIIDHLQKNKEKSNFLTEFKQSVSELKQIYVQFDFYRFYDRAYAPYQIWNYRQSLIKRFKQFVSILKYSQNSSLKGIAIWCFLCKAFYFTIICTSIIIASFLVYNSMSKEKIRLKESVVIWMQVLLCVFILTFLFLFVGSSFMLSISATFYSLFQKFNTHPELFRQQVSQLEFIYNSRQFVPFLLSPYNLTLDSINNGKYVQQSTRYINFFAPYAERKPTYFYDMLNESLFYVKDDSFREETIALMRMKERVLKEPFAAHFKTFHQYFKKVLHFIGPEGVYDRLNGGAVGEVVLSAAKIFSSFMVNRSFQYHEICGRLSILLSLVLLLTFVNLDDLEFDVEQFSMIEMQDKESGQKTRNTVSSDIISISK